MKTLAAIVAALMATAALAQPAPPVVVRGAITKVVGTTLSVTSNDGAALTVVLAPGAKVAALTTIGIDAIKPNSFIGTAARPGPGDTLVATEVHVFPESMRGLGEGHRAWDLGANSSMTNGNVAKVAKSGAITARSGRTLTVDYKGGTKQVTVPASVPIVAFAEGDTTQLVPGAHIFAFTMKTPDGRLAANQVAVGVGGVVPPM